MKRIVLSMLVIMSIVGIVACSSEKDEKKEKQEVVVGEVKSKESVEQTSEEETTNTDLQKDTEKIYFMDKQTGEMICEEEKIENIDEFLVWEKLQEKGVVPADAKVNSLKKEGTTLVLDLDIRFGDFFRQQGTLGENEVLKCIVNTYLDMFEAEQIKITEEGYDLTSSHKIYDGYMTKIEQ